MNARRTAIHLTALLLLLAGAVAQDQSLQVGAPAPDLHCKDAASHDVTWDTFAGRAVLLFFFNQDMAFSRQGLEAVANILATAEDLKPATALLIVSNGPRDLGWLQEQLDHSKLPGAITLDPERVAFRDYHVVAFPTVICVSKDHRVAQMAKGYGPLLPSKVLAGARLAAGLLDEQGFQQAINRSEIPADSDEMLKVMRAVRMAQQLFAASMLEEARNTLEKVVRPDSRNTEAIALLARVQLAQGRRDDAKVQLDRLAALVPDQQELKELRAELALLAGDAEAALQQLDGLNEKELRVAMVKGRALEHLQRFREAAEVYRKALAATLEHAR